MDLRVYVDSDVIISSIISPKGAAFYLINEASIKRFISNKSQEEIKRVASELSLNQKNLNEIIKNRFSKVELKASLEKIKKKYSEYVKDQNDAHIVAGAHAVNSKFIISYNQKDYNSDKIKENLSIIMMTPAKFLQYLRSLG